MVAESVEAEVPNRAKVVNEKPLRKRYPNGLNRQSLAAEVVGVEVDGLPNRLGVLVDSAPKSGDSRVNRVALPRTGRDRLADVYRSLAGRYRRVGGQSARVVERVDARPLDGRRLAKRTLRLFLKMDDEPHHKVVVGERVVEHQARSSTTDS